MRCCWITAWLLRFLGEALALIRDLLIRCLILSRRCWITARLLRFLSFQGLMLCMLLLGCSWTRARLLRNLEALGFLSEAFASIKGNVF